MKGRATPDFWSCFAKLPPDIRRRAGRTYARWLRDPAHPGLRFRRLNTKNPVYSIRIACNWRALGVRDGDTIVWFWIGNHGDYDAMIARL